MDSEFLKHVVEALIFASDIPISVEHIKDYIEETTVSKVKKAVEELNLEYNKNNHSF